MLYLIYNEEEELIDVLELNDKEKKAFIKSNPTYTLIEQIESNPFEAFDPTVSDEDEFYN